VSSKDQEIEPQGFNFVKEEAYLLHSPAHAAYWAGKWLRNWGIYARQVDLKGPCLFYLSSLHWVNVRVLWKGIKEGQNGWSCTWEALHCLKDEPRMGTNVCQK
jgi:hypothetical protein